MIVIAIKVDKEHTRKKIDYKDMNLTETALAIRELELIKKMLLELDFKRT